MSDLLITFIVALISMVIGYLIAMVVRGSQKKENDEPVNPQSPELDARLTQSISTPEEDDLAVFYRTELGGNLNIKIAGVRIDDPEKMSPDQRQRLVSLITELKPWLVSGVQLSKPVPSSREIRPVPPRLELDPTAINRTSTISPVQKSMVVQIDDILQEQIAGTPLAQREIRMTETLDQGVLVWIGARSYAGIDSVPEKEIQAAIRRAVKTWEDREA